jgi:hypothetical protein
LRNDLRKRVEMRKESDNKKVVEIWKIRRKVKDKRKERRR